MRNSERGFSFAELLIAVAIVGIASIGISLGLLALFPAAAIAALELTGRRLRRYFIPRVPTSAARPQPVPQPQPALRLQAAPPSATVQVSEVHRLEMNPYQVLRIQRSATLTEIEDAYCLMRKLSFYGTVRDPLAIIDLAHDLLKDPESRREVDEALRHHDQPAAFAPRYASPRGPLMGA